LILILPPEVFCHVSPEVEVVDGLAEVEVVNALRRDGPDELAPPETVDLMVGEQGDQMSILKITQNIAQPIFS
jgi:hypothetical protein